MSRLVTERVSKAEATQRQGRAGRVAPGTCYRLWTRGEEGGLPPFPPAEIETADLAPLALELAAWGSADGSDLAFLTPPPAGALAEARDLLTGLGALQGDRITAHGRQLSKLPLHPRLAHMLTIGGKQAAPLAAILSSRDPLRGGPSDLSLRIKAVTGRYEGPGQVNHAALSQIRDDAKRLAKGKPDAPRLSLAAQAALAVRVPVP